VRKFPLMLFGILLAVAARSVASFTERLPEVVAVHFNPQGTANGFMTREDCRTFMWAFTLGVPLFIAAVTAVVPRLIPTSMVNIPNHNYWLAPERAAESLASLSEQGVWFGCIFLVFLTGVDWMIVKANAAAPPEFPTALFAWTLLLFFCAIAIWALRMFKRFRVPP
jgi:uncharacterized membrane protein